MTDIDETPKSEVKSFKPQVVHSSYMGSPFGTSDQNGQYGSRYGSFSLIDERNYRDLLRDCRWFYRFNPTCSTVINRMVEMTVTKIKNVRKLANDAEVAYFGFVAEKLSKVLREAATLYLVDGMALPDFDTERIMGSRFSNELDKPRERYVVPKQLWVRNNDNIVVKKDFGGTRKKVFFRVPGAELDFIRSKGKYPDGTEDTERYKALEEQHPKYVKAVQGGKDTFPIDNRLLIQRKATPFDDMPQPFLVPALAALRHKQRLLEMDHSIASRAVHGILHIRLGDKDNPAGDDDAEALRQQISPRSYGKNPEQIYAVITPYNVSFEWIYPKMEALMSDTKYTAADAEVFVALGFSRILLVGETLRSNAAQSITSTLGPIAALREIQEMLLEWVEWLYEFLAAENGFKNWPKPEFSPITSTEIISLVQFAIEAMKLGALSRDTVASMFGKDFETERVQIESEADVTDQPEPTLVPEQDPKLQKDLAKSKSAAAKPVTKKKPTVAPDTNQGA